MKIILGTYFHLQHRNQTSFALTDEWYSYRI
jgi:hypothetical protein